MPWCGTWHSASRVHGTYWTKYRSIAPASISLKADGRKKDPPPLTRPPRASMRRMQSVVGQSMRRRADPTPSRSPSSRPRSDGRWREVEPEPLEHRAPESPGAGVPPEYEANTASSEHRAARSSSRHQRADKFCAKCWKKALRAAHRGWSAAPPKPPASREASAGGGCAERRRARARTRKRALFSRATQRKR